MSICIKFSLEPPLSRPIAAVGAASSSALKLLVVCAEEVLPAELSAPLGEPAFGSADTSNTEVNTEGSAVLIAASVCVWVIGGMVGVTLATDKLTLSAPITGMTVKAAGEFTAAKLPFTLLAVSTVKVSPTLAMKPPYCKVLAVPPRVALPLTLIMSN